MARTYRPTLLGHLRDRMMRRGRNAVMYTATELGPAEAAPILKRYLAEHPRTVGAYSTWTGTTRWKTSRQRPHGIRCSASTPPAPEESLAVTSRLVRRAATDQLPLHRLISGRLMQDLDVPVRSVHADPLPIPDQPGGMLA